MVDEATATSADHDGLIVRNLAVAHGHTQVLFGVDIEVRPGELVALLGTNGAGKTTLLDAIGGSLRPMGGTVRFNRRDITKANAVETVGEGVVIVPGGRGVFPDLTVAENLRLAGWLYTRDSAFLAEATERVLEYFPILRERWHTAAGNMSGGEQQMLCLGQGFISKPKLLMIDELSLGLAPTIVEQLVEIVQRINGDGVSVLMVEQSANVALRIADRALFMEKGEIHFEGAPADLLAQPDVVRAVFLEGTGSAGTQGGRTPLRRDKFRHTCDACGAQPELLLSVDGLTKSFGGITAVSDVSFELRSGEILGLIGPNGAGKTTIFDLISGFIIADSGEVVFDGVDVTDWTPDHRALLGLGRSFQDSRLFPALTVAETVAVALERHVDVPQPLAAAVVSPAVKLSEQEVAERVGELLDSMGLTQFEDHFIDELSTGVRRLVDLACVLAHDPKVLLLDEPSSGIAQKETEELGRTLLAIRERTGAALLVIEHDMPMITGISDQIVALELGTVITRDDPDKVLRHPRVVASYLGTSEQPATPKTRRRAPLQAKPRPRRGATTQQRVPRR